MSICRCQTHDITWDSDFKESCPKCAPTVDALYDGVDELDKFLEYMSNLSDNGFNTNNEKFPFVFKILSDSVEKLNKKIQKINEKMFS